MNPTAPTTVIVTVLLSVFFIFTLSFAFATAPDAVHAQGFEDTLSGEPIVPCGNEGQRECGFCELGELSTRIVNFLIFFAVVVAVLMFIWAGFLYLTAAGSQTQISRAHSIFWTVFIGFIFVLLSWVIVDAIIKAFVPKSVQTEFGPWNQLKCAQEPERPTSETGGTDTGGTDTGTDTGTGTPLTQAEAESQLSAAGISVVSSGGCTDQNNSTCTSLEGINQETIDEAIRLKQECGCDVIVTGGTEVGHAAGEFSHANGYKIDVDDSAGVTNYVTDTCTFVGTSGFDNIYDCDGKEYRQESDHWDIQVIP